MTITESKLNAIGNVVGYAIGLAILFALLVFYNHVLFQHPLAWWQYALIAVALSYMQWALKWTRKVVAIVSTAAVVAQLLAWAGLVSLPLIKL